jgi:ribonuclease HI
MEGDQPNVWIVNVDGSSNQNNNWVNVSSPNNITMECAIRFCFEASNNDPKYESPIARPLMAKKLEAHAVYVRSDSKLVVDQLTRKFKAKRDKM